MANPVVTSSAPFPDQSYPQANYPPQQQYPQVNYPQQQPYPQAYYPPTQYPPSAQPYTQQPYPGQVAYVGQPNSGYSTPSSGGQQQQQTVIMGTATLVPAGSQHPPPPSHSYIPHIVIAAISILFCWIFGAAALYMAVVARNSLSHPIKARQLGCSSLGFSITGILIGVGVIIGLAVGLSRSTSSTSYCNYYYYSCY